jgi:hypothetical protein
MCATSVPWPPVTSSGVEVALADVLRRLGDRSDRAELERRPTRLREAGSQRRRLGRRPDDAHLDVVGMRLVVGADDAEREHGHEEDGHEQRRERQPRLRALDLGRRAVGLSGVGHRRLLYAWVCISVPASTCCLVIVR